MIELQKIISILIIFFGVYFYMSFGAVGSDQGGSEIDLYNKTRIIHQQLLEKTLGFQTISALESACQKARNILRYNPEEPNVSWWYFESKQTAANQENLFAIEFSSLCYNLYHMYNEVFE